MVTLGPEADFRGRAAALLRSVANDLKRNDRNAEADLGLEAGAFAEYTTGKRPITWELVSRAAQVWPLNERDLLPIHDDAPDGARVHRLKESVASARVIERGGGPYYEYRDTAMSRLASYRPEWIRMLRVVDDDDPANPAVQWNRGHLLYQFTYFVGPVNYYYRWGDESHCVPMTTGDSVWGVPFAPHSFAARSDVEPALILALTYGGDLSGDAQRELSTLGSRAAEDLALPVGSHGALLRSFLDARAMTAAELADRSGLIEARVRALCADEDRPGGAELTALAAALGVPVRELLAARTHARGGVSIQTARTARRWAYPDADRPSYRITQLAGDPLHPHTSALEVEVLAAHARPGAWLTTYQHQYAYVLGGEPVCMRWRRGGEELAERLDPGDSAYVMPGMPLCLTVPAGGRPRVLLLRIRGTVTPEVRFALGAMASGGVGRYVAEDRLWY